jgi:hypothetical protein
MNQENAVPEGKYQYRSSAGRKQESLAKEKVVERCDERDV